LPQRRRWAWGALAVLVVAGVFTWRAWRTPENQEPLRAVPLTTLPGTDRYPSFSSDGNYVAFTWTGPKEDNPDVYVQQIGSGSPLRLTTDPGNDYNPVWSPDGRWIAFLRSRSETGTSEVRLIAPLGGPERTVTVIRLFGGISLTPPYLAWVPDSSHLVVTDSPGAGKPDALFIVSLETGEKRQLTDPSAPASGDTNPAVSPDGNSLVFRRQAGGVFNGELYQLPLARGLTAAGAPRRLTPAIMDALYPTWLPDSRTILFSAKAGLWRLAVSGDDQPTRLPFVGEDGSMPVVSRPLAGRPSRLVYVRSFDDTNIWAPRDSCSRCDGTIITASVHLVDARRMVSPILS
jgi:Tol biopolymer transport system component